MDFDFKYLFDKIRLIYPQAECELVFHNPFQLLVAVILSAQSTDKQVNIVTEKLFKKIKNPQDILNMGLAQLLLSINSIGLFNSKGNNIYKLCLMLVDDDYKRSLQTVAKLPISYQIYNKYGYFLPERLEDFVKLPGVGPKTAKILLNHIFKIPYIPADTHVHRVSNRIGFVKTNSPEKTSELLEKIVPETLKLDAHILLVYFGRYHCKSVKPKCNVCPFTKFCKYYLEN